MPDIYDPERGLKIGLTDEDYENYQNGNLSDDFYARRTDGSIANRVTISPLDDDNDEDGEPSGGIDPGSAVIGALIMATIAGATYGIKKLWDRHKAKKAETQVNVRKEEGTQLSTETACEVLSTETAKSNDAEPKSLTQEEAIQELMKILVGMAEIAAGKKKVSEGVENLSNAGIVDRMVLLKKLSDSQTLESCKFAIWKNNKWWELKRKQPTKAIVTALLKDGRAHVTGLYSEKTGKTYDATVVLEDDGKYANFKLAFDRQKGGGK